MKVQITYITICFLCCLSLVAPNAYESNIIFRVFNSNGVQFNSTFDDNSTLLANCRSSGNYTVLTHGWGESILSFWPASLIQQFLQARQGCVFFMDYYFYSKLDYATLVSNFNGIQAVMTRKLQQLDQLGFNPTNAHLFGFSFGAHVVFEGAYQYGPQKIARVDCCEPAGPYFPATAPSVIHAINSGKQVQCIHTSSDKGTTFRFCHKNINMGNCGTVQIGATSPPLLSHGMCPLFYTNSFAHSFALVPKTIIQTAYSVLCYNQTITPNITLLAPAQMGFWLNMSIPNGEYYSNTKTLAPFV